MGDFVAPQFERWGDEMRGRHAQRSLRRQRRLVKDHQVVDGRERSYRCAPWATAGCSPARIRVRRARRLLSRREAASADVNEAGLWRLHEVHDTQWSTEPPAVGAPAVRETEADES